MQALREPQDLAVRADQRELARLVPRDHRGHRGQQEQGLVARLDLRAQEAHRDQREPQVQQAHSQMVKYSYLLEVVDLERQIPVRH